MIIRWLPVILVIVPIFPHGLEIQAQEPAQVQEESEGEGTGELKLAPLDESRVLLLVTGAAGEAPYEALFQQWGDRWLDNARLAGIRTIHVSAPDDQQNKTVRQQLQQQVESLASDPSVLEAWIVLIGHGTFDGNTARFNLAGPDVSARELADWLEPRNRLTVIINCASSSAPFATALTGSNRMIVTATSSGFEQNFARFGRYMVDAIVDPRHDLDKDNQISLLEAFVAAANQTAEFYSSDKRLATEHAMIEDNGDGMGTRFDWFRGTRVIKQARDKTEPDGRRANQVFFLPSEHEQQLTPGQRAERDRLETMIESLRRRKGEMNEDDYYRQLEPVMLDLARLYFPDK